MKMEVIAIRINVMKNMKYYRNNLAITQKDLSKFSGVPLNCIKSYETGRRIPDAINLFLICKSLGVSMEELISERN